MRTHRDLQAFLCNCTSIQPMLWMCISVYLQKHKLARRPFWTWFPFGGKGEIYQKFLKRSPLNKRIYKISPHSTRSRASPSLIIHFSTLPASRLPSASLSLSPSLPASGYPVRHGNPGMLACSDAILLICAHAPRTCQNAVRLACI